MIAHRYGAVTALAALAACSVLAAAPANVRAQEPARASIDSLRAQVARLEAQLDSLRRMVASGQAPQQAVAAEDSAGDALAGIRAAAAAAVAEDSATRPPPTVAEGQFIGRQRNLSVFNPELSVTGDIFAVVNQDRANDDNFVPREFELALQSNLDPYSRAKIFVAYHNPGAEIVPFIEPGAEPDCAGVEVEEGYVQWVNLPAGLGLTVGKFRQRFGKYNRWHPHALPAQMLPLPYIAFLGEEGLVQTGASVHWLAPIHSGGTYELWTEVTRSSDDVLFGESNNVSVLGHVNGFWQLDPATYFELGLSGITGSHAGPLPEDEFGARVYGIDFTLDWRPPAQALYRGASLNGGLVWNRRAYDDDTADLTAFGAFAIGEVRLSRRWLAGARYEYTENPAAPDQHSWLAAPTLTWWQSEFVRLRAEYDILNRPGDDTFGQLVIQTTFAMGPHKHETY